MKVEKKLRVILLLVVTIFSSSIYAGKGGNVIPIEINSKKMNKYLDSCSDNDTDKIIVEKDDVSGDISRLKNSQKTPSTTSCRKEQKAVIKKKTFKKLKKNLVVGKKSHKKNLPGDRIDELVSRDIVPENGKNSTLTIYGSGAAYDNESVQTNFIMRARFYLITGKDKKGKKIAERSPVTKNDSFLEIKIRNPSEEHFLGVNKYRVKIADEDLVKIFYLDSTASHYDEELRGIMARAMENPANKRKEAKSMLKLISKMVKIDPRFTSPQMVVTYERTSYKYVENEYNYTDVHGEAKSSDSPVEYQITVDDKIRISRPEFEEGKPLSIEKYYGKNAKNFELARYSKDALAVEFKDPYPYANFLPENRSAVHNIFYSKIVDPFQSEGNVIKNFKINKGKAGNFRLTKDILRNFKKSKKVKISEREKRAPKVCLEDVSVDFYNEISEIAKVSSHIRQINASLKSISLKFN